MNTANIRLLIKEKISRQKVKEFVDFYAEKTAQDFFEEFKKPLDSVSSDWEAEAWSGKDRYDIVADLYGLFCEQVENSVTSEIEAILNDEYWPHYVKVLEEKTQALYEANK